MGKEEVPGGPGVEPVWCTLGQPEVPNFYNLRHYSGPTFLERRIFLVAILPTDVRHPGP